MKEKLTQKRLKELINYCQHTGVFIWVVSRKGIRKNKVAGSLKKNGYNVIFVDGNEYLSHRLAWLYVYGYFPENQIDHIDRNKSNNKITNLREVSAQCNIRNIGVRSNSKTGVTGVTIFRGNKWQSRITVSGITFYLGVCKTFEDAVYKRWIAEKKYGFPNCNTTSPAYNYLKENGCLK